MPRALATALAALAVGVIGATACGIDAVGSLEVVVPGVDPMPVPPGADGSGGDPFEASAGEAGDASSEAAAVACPLGDGGTTGVLCAGNCVDLTRNHENCGACAQPCPGSSACEGTCVAVAVALDALRYEVPCTDNGSPYCKSGSAPAPKVATLTGTASKSYTLTLRVRGVVEQKSYSSVVAGTATGTNAAFFITSGNPASDGWNSYLLAVSSPAMTAYLNRGSSNHDYVDGIDYTTAVTAAAGATVTLDSSSSDSYIVKNRDQATGAAIVIPVIKPAPQAFNGQFLQVDVLGVSLAP
jgi:hypothetical protein